MDASAIAHALRNGRRSGRSWVASCPAHEDRSPSLSLRDSTDGRVLVHCHAGCSQVAVVTALKGLRLWPERTKRNTRGAVVAEYSYTDAEGVLLYQVVRTDPKGFFQRYWDGGGWTYRKHPHQVLYHLPEILTAAIVFVVEGERDVETLRSHGFVATTIAGGANAAWLADFTSMLRGHEVVLLPDNDDPGWAFMGRVAEALLKEVGRLMCFDDHHRAGAKDITDWFEMGHSETEFIHLLEACACRSK